jgi:hypothetical protein
MRSTAGTVVEYLASLPEDRRKAISSLRKTLVDNLPKGFKEVMSYGMLGFVVPHSRYPAGYHCDPEQPLPFINVASQKNFVALYHMGLYSDKKLLKWFQEEYPRHSKSKLDMGKSCVRFKRTGDIPLSLIAELAKKISPDKWIERYESALKR